jgi:predicted DNA-binding protein
MGRPPLGNKATQVRLPESVMERIDALMGPNRRAKFIREAVEAELTRREGRGKK